jgi:hypothetical protein
MPVVGQYFGEAGRNVDERIAIRVARFDQRDRRIGVFGEITRNDAAGRARTNNDNVVGFLGHQCLFFFTPFVSFNQHPCRSSAIVVPDPEIDWTMLLENDLATLAREITSRHRVDRRSLLPLAPRRDAVARIVTSRTAPRNRRCYSAEKSKPRSVAVSAINAVAACITGAAKVAQRAPRRALIWCTRTAKSARGMAGWRHGARLNRAQTA